MGAEHQVPRETSTDGLIEAEGMAQQQGEWLVSWGVLKYDMAKPFEYVCYDTTQLWELCHCSW